VTERTLGALQVGALLVSASYGIGFLFGSGEYALRYGMAGAIYGVATGLGMIAMADFAGRLWQAGRAVWDLLGDRCGDRVRRLVALLSIVWMAGVLAAQIHGAVAVVRLLGAGSVAAHALAIALIFAASRFALRAASVVFAGCLFALVTSGGIAVYATSLPAFAQALPSLGVAQAITIAIGVGLLVCTGADYHQFVLAARAPGAAVRGCLLAGVGLLLLAFLPPAVVLSAIAQPSWPGVADAKQVVPQALALAAADLAVVAAPAMLGVLGVAALGSGAAVLRAMVSALQAARPDGASASPLVLAAIAMAVATALTASDLPIVDTMVSVTPAGGAASRPMCQLAWRSGCSAADRTVTSSGGCSGRRATKRSDWRGGRAADRWLAAAQPPTAPLAAAQPLRAHLWTRRSAARLRAWRVTGVAIWPAPHRAERSAATCKPVSSPSGPRSRAA
jgi:solute:Na+ symporter, SSS family